MPATSFNIGGVEGQIANLNDHIGTLDSETKPLSSTVNISIKRYPALIGVRDAQTTDSCIAMVLDSAHTFNVSKTGDIAGYTFSQSGNNITISATHELRCGVIY